MGIRLFRLDGDAGFGAVYTLHLVYTLGEAAEFLGGGEFSVSYDIVRPGDHVGPAHPINFAYSLADLPDLSRLNTDKYVNHYRHTT